MLLYLSSGCGKMLNSIEMYDIELDTWTYVTNHLPVLTDNLYGLYEAASCEWRGKIVVSAMQIVQIYDPANDTW